MGACARRIAPISPLTNPSSIGERRAVHAAWRMPSPHAPRTHTKPLTSSVERLAADDAAIPGVSDTGAGGARTKRETTAPEAAAAPKKAASPRSNQIARRDLASSSQKAKLQNLLRKSANRRFWHLQFYPTPVSAAVATSRGNRWPRDRYLPSTLSIASVSGTLKFFSS